MSRDVQLASTLWRKSTLCMTECLSLGTSIVYDILFFFQAEDGIRDLTVTGVQTCALPIFELTRDVAPRSVEGGEVVGSLTRQDRLRRGSLERGPAQQREVRHGAERVQVGPLIHPLAQQLFGSGELGRPAARGGAAEAVAAQRQRQSEVRDAQPAVGLDQHVLGLEVAVDQPLGVRLLERRQGLVEQSYSPLEAERPLALHELRQVD